MTHDLRAELQHDRATEAHALSDVRQRVTRALADLESRRLPSQRREASITTLRQVLGWIDMHHDRED